MTITWAAYSVVSAYVASGLVGYVAARPRAKGVSVRKMKVHKGPLARSLANAVQSVNFTASRVRRPRVSRVAPVSTLFDAAVLKAFDPTLPFIVTGAPHARAYYSRNFAWFYPDLLNPHSITSREDAERRRMLLERSVAIMLTSLRQGVHTTTLVPVSQHRYVGINYFEEPSDTLLGVLSAINQLVKAGHITDSEYSEVFVRASAFGKDIITTYRSVLERALINLASSLEHYEKDGHDYLLCDVRMGRSSATDTRAERLRFVTNANIWTTFARAVDLAIVSEERLETVLGRSLKTYKEEILTLFGSRGFIEHSLEIKNADPASSIALDFAHIRNGFWDFQSARERELFKRTADIVLADTRFRAGEGDLYLMSVNRSKLRMIHRLVAPSYQGRTAWPSFNVDFADRLLDLAGHEHAPKYADKARKILRRIKTLTEIHGGYYELLAETGAPYKTWMYQSAIANSWFPRFISVSHRAFDKSLLS